MSLLSAHVVLRRGAFSLDARFEAPLDGVTCLFGPSGAGKSTLLAALAGLAPLDAGRVALDACVLDDVAGRVRTPAEQRGVGLVFQDARLLPHLTVAGNLSYALKRAPAGKPRLGVAALAERFQIGALLERPVYNLSGGEKSRVALARAIASAPDLLLLDEPFAALDGARRRTFLQDLRDLNCALGLPMIVVTHQIDDAAALADHVVALEAGRVAAAGPFAEVAPTAPFQALLDARDSGVALSRERLKTAVSNTGAHVWVRADSVLLAARKPERLSARNVWEGDVVSIAPEGEGAQLVLLRTEVGLVFARVTSAAVADLSLTVGSPAWAIFKAFAV